MLNGKYNVQYTNETESRAGATVSRQGTVMSLPVPAADERPARAWLRVGVILFAIALGGLLVCLLLRDGLKITGIAGGVVRGLLCSMGAGVLLAAVNGPILLASGKFKVNTANICMGEARVTLDFNMASGVNYSVAVDGKWMEEDVRSPYAFRLSGSGQHQVQLIAGGVKCVDTVTVRVK